MPSLLADDILGGEAFVVDVDYADLGVAMVTEMARLGDMEARAWLESVARTAAWDALLPRQADGWDEALHPRGEGGRFGEKGGDAESELVQRDKATSATRYTTERASDGREVKFGPGFKPEVRTQIVARLDALSARFPGVRPPSSILVARGSGVEGVARPYVGRMDFSRGIAQGKGPPEASFGTATQSTEGMIDHEFGHYALETMRSEPGWDDWQLATSLALGLSTPMTDEQRAVPDPAESGWRPDVPVEKVLDWQGPTLYDRLERQLGGAYANTSMDEAFAEGFANGLSGSPSRVGTEMVSLADAWVGPSSVSAAFMAAAGDWAEEMHPRGEGGKFAPKEDDAEPAEKPAGSSPIRGVGDTPSRLTERARVVLDATMSARLERAHEEGSLFVHPKTGEVFAGERADLIVLGREGEYKMLAANTVQQAMTTPTGELAIIAQTVGGYGFVGTMPTAMSWGGADGWRAVWRDVETTSTGLVRPDDPEFDGLVRDWAVGRMIHEWAGSSNDTNAMSLAIQDAAEQEFGLQGIHPWQMSDELRDSVARQTEEHGEAYRDFVRAQYESTQGLLREAGIEQMALYRATAVEKTPETLSMPRQAGEMEHDLRPINSFASARDIAEHWSAGYDGVKVILDGIVPADRILATPATGIGCLDESEVVVLGGGDTRFDVEHVRADSDRAEAMKALAVDALGDLPSNWTVTDVSNNTTPGQAEDAWTVAVRDTYTGYTRTVDTVTNPDGTLSIAGEMPHLWTRDDRMHADLDVIATAELPAGWQAVVVNGDNEWMPTTIDVRIGMHGVDPFLTDVNAATFPYFQVDSGGGITEAGAQRMVDTAVATWAAKDAAAAAANEAHTEHPNEATGSMGLGATPGARLDGTAHGEGEWRRYDVPQYDSETLEPTGHTLPVVYGAVAAQASAQFGDAVRVAVSYTPGDGLPSLDMDVQVPRDVMFANASDASTAIRDQVSEAFAAAAEARP